MLYNVFVENKAELCKGSTADSDSVCWGSNPYSAAKTKILSIIVGRFFVLYYSFFIIQYSSFIKRDFRNEY